MIEKRISELQERLIKISQAEMQKKKLKKTNNRTFKNYKIISKDVIYT